MAKGTITSLSCDPTTNGFQLTQSYVVGPGGEELTMLDGSNNWQRTNVYGAGKLLATYDMISDPASSSPSLVPALHFQLTDPLGTRRMQTSSVGQPETDIQSLPFGDQLSSFPDPDAPGTADDATPLHFTGKERDTESGNDYFGARYYASTMGRFLSPDYQNLDDGDTPEAIYYGAVTNPQTLNLYSYGENNPLSKRDYDGHASWGPCANDANSQCWNGDYNGERDCSGSGGCLFWNGSTNQWQANDPTPPSNPDGFGAPIGVVFGGFYRAALSHSGADLNYGLQQMACGALGGTSQCSTQTGQDFAAIAVAAGPVSRPAFVPKNWIEKPSNEGTGVKWVDPSNPHNSVRLEPAKPGSSNPGQQQDYMVVTKNGQTLDMNGNAVPRQSLDSHIPQGTELPPETFGPIE